MVEPELITILEGPTPAFRPSHELGLQSVCEGPTAMGIALCQLRTLKGPSILARCKEAWQGARPVKLDYPDHLRMRQQAEVVAMRLQEIPEGMVLLLWVRLPYAAEFVQEGEGDDDSDDFGD
ncbi:MAG: hypothetical protein AB1791_18040 [Chloroflexota bacterium]